jgi:pimeloyl-ACP methyl ester carboxylesterase
MPTLVLWAANDIVLPPRIGRRLAADLPNATLEVIPSCGHFLQEEKPAEVTRHLLHFLHHGCHPSGASRVLNRTGAKPLHGSE